MKLDTVSQKTRRGGRHVTIMCMPRPRSFNHNPTSHPQANALHRTRAKNRECKDVTSKSIGERRGLPAPTHSQSATKGKLHRARARNRECKDATSKFTNCTAQG